MIIINFLVSAGPDQNIWNRFGIKEKIAQEVGAMDKSGISKKGSKENMEAS